MKQIKTFSLFLALVLLFGAARKEDKVDLVKIKTSYGEMVVYLYDATPIHKANFLSLAKSKFYDGTTFHRIIQGFMIQGGDGNSKDKDSTNDGSGGAPYTGAPNQEPDGMDKKIYTIPAEFLPNVIHKKGTIAAARNGDDVNPQRRSSGSQFYIVQGKVYSEAELKSYAQRRGITLNESQIKTYTTIGGTPHLDGAYTVFGELISGMDVVEKIAVQPKDRMNDRPLKNIAMTVTVERMKAKDVLKKYGVSIPGSVQVK